MLTSADHVKRLAPRLDHRRRMTLPSTAPTPDHQLSLSLSPCPSDHTTGDRRLFCSVVRRHLEAVTYRALSTVSYHYTRRDIAKMGMTHKQYLSSSRIFGCQKCRTHLATIDSLISRVSLYQARICSQTGLCRLASS